MLNSHSSFIRKKNLPKISKRELVIVCFKISFVIFLVEGMIMLLIPYFRDFLDDYTQAALDVGLLITLSTPLMAYFVIRPYIFQRNKAEKEAHDLQRLAYEEREKLLLRQKSNLQQVVRKATERIKLSEERYALAAKGANDGLWDWNLETNKIFYSDRFMEIIGLKGQSFKDTPQEWFARVHEEDYPQFMSHFQCSIDQNKREHFECEYRMLHENGKYIWVLSRWITLYDKKGHAKRYVGSQTEITSRKAMEERLVHDALHDHLTSLPNRILFNDRLEQTLIQHERDNSHQFAVLCIDIDNFKNINNTLGHQAGDDLLVEVAHRLRGRVRAGDTVSRLGGDEFAIILNDIQSDDELKAILARISQNIIKIFETSDQKVPVTTSIGVVHVTSSNPYQTSNEILRDADIALYRAKADGKNCFAIFERDMHLAVKRNFELTHSLRDAIEAQNMFVYYQPIIHLKDMNIGGFEALIRWHHPQLGWIPPSQFIPLAEGTDMIGNIGKFVLEQSCQQLALWRHQIPQAEQWFMAVNVSAEQLENEDILELLNHLLCKNSLPAHLIKLEVTENVLISHDKIVEDNLLKLRRMGVKIAIDDFGTGYSSLNTLNTIPFDVLKIDRVFIHDLNTNKKSQNMVNFITTLTDTLDMEAVAEGIESQEQLTYLKKTRCKFGQGYFLGHPMPAHELEQKVFPRTRLEEKKNLSASKSMIALA